MVVELAQAGGHLAGAGAGGRDHHQGVGGLDEFIPAVALGGDDFGDVVGVALDGVVGVDLDAQVLQAAAEGVRGPLAGILGDDHAAHEELLRPEGVDEAQHVLVVGDAQIAPDLVLLNGGGVDGNDDFRGIPQLQEHADLAVRREAGENSGGVIVVEELAAEFQIELAAELLDALPDPGGLGIQIHLVVKANQFPHGSPPSCEIPVSRRRISAPHLRIVS